MNYISGVLQIITPNEKLSKKRDKRKKRLIKPEEASKQNVLASHQAVAQMRDNIISIFTVKLLSLSINNSPFTSSHTAPKNGLLKMPKEAQSHRARHARRQAQERHVLRLAV